MISSITTRGNQYFEITELYVACFLDPRFKSFQFLLDINKKKSVLQKVMSFLSTERLNLKYSNLSSLPSQARNIQLNQRLLTNKSFSLFDSNSILNYDSIDLDDEISNYSNMNVHIVENYNPLEFYKTFSDQFSILSQIAKKIFSFPISSVASERLFSKIRRDY